MLLLGAGLLTHPADAVAPVAAAVLDGSSLESAQRISDMAGCGSDGSLQPIMDPCSLTLKLSGGGAARW